ncbi:PKD domain-containing protein, partial [Microbacterium sp. LRZ72]|uniref:PKD domain-containing protein n=1 Tax=Microbacterium sp. LRZ72 TaxID=2942481 RepID=UPI0029A789DB
MNTSALVRRVVAGATAVVLIAAGAVALSASPATAADELPSPAPLLQRDESVATADPLPTVQIDEGFVWAQTTIGNTVYAAGSFSNARAPLAAPGTNLTPRNNLLAFDITTGDLLPFAPDVNGEIRSIAASPDGTRIYIGGSFNSVNGQARWNFAALDATTGQLVSGFQPAIGGVGVYGIVATDATVYLAGLFTQANGVARTNFAAVAASNGALQTWAPESDLQVDALVEEPGTGRLIAGGRFYEVNGVVQRGLAALDPASGALYDDWQAPDTIKNGWNEGQNAGRAGIFALATDDTGIYGTGWVFANAATGNLEGTFAADAGTGAVRWVADCHGDHYGVYSNGDIVYTTTHTHQCDTVSLWPELSPRQYRYVEAYTTDARGVLPRTPSAGSLYQDWQGTPSPSVYNWFPDFTVGTASGLGQAGLSITGAGDYVAVAGEFTSVNNQRYQGIVRFSTSPSSGADQGPRLSGADWEPTARSVTPGRVRVSVPMNYDRDDLDLTYELLREGESEPVVSRIEESRWWVDTDVILEEKDLAAGSTHTYRVRVTDGDGNAVTSDPVTVSVADGEPSLYADTVLDDGATLYYPLGEIHDDWAGDNPQVRGDGVTDVTPGAVEGSTGAGATEFSGTSAGRITAGDRVSPGEEFSVELWFKTDTTRGGKLIGYGNSRTGTSGSHDRHVYMQNSGRLTFGVYPGSTKTISSPASYNDDEWHHVVATQGEAGMSLYVDGELVAGDASVTTAQSYTGYWRIGGDNTSGWPSSPTSSYFAGEIDEVAVYASALTAGQVSAHTAAGEGLETPTAAFESAATDLDVEFDGTGSTADDGRTIVGYEWDFGDGSAVATGATVQHSYATAGSYEVSLTVTDDRGLTAVVSQEVVVEAPNVDPTAEFTSTVNSLTATFDGSASSDADGDIATYEWDFGDGSDPGSGSTVSHVYASDGDYTVTLTVTDDRGGEASTTSEVTVSHDAPVASFESTTTGLGVSVDATGSSAADGASLEYSWNWGDGTADATGVGASHTYSEAGEYTVTLTVTDEFGATATETGVVTVTAAPVEAVVLADAFERSVASGWGSADVGGPWSAMWGAASAGSVADGRGLVSLDAGQTRNFAAEDVAVSDVSASVEFALESDPSTGNAYAGLAARQSASENYTTRAWMRSDGSVWLVVQRSGTVLAAPILNGVSWAEGDVFRMETEVTGANPTTIRSKLWKDGSAEPAGWQASVTDSEAGLQDAGWVSTHFARAGSAASAGTIAFDEVSVTDLSAPVTDPGDPDEPVNEDPVASFSSEVADLDVSVDASGSSDADGSVDSYAWSWGDGSADGSGVTASHTYAAAGEYTVTLTVTDDEGAEASSTETVTVTEPVTDPGDPDPVEPAVVLADAFERSVASGWGSADVGGPWS